MNIQSNWVESVPDIVGAYISQSAQGVYLPRSAGEWRCHYSFDDSSDMYVTGFACAGPHEGSIMILADARNFETLCSLVAATCDAMPTTNVPVKVLSEDVASILKFCAKVSLTEEEDNHDGRSTESDNTTGLHVASRQMRNVPLAREEAGENS